MTNMRHGMAGAGLMLVAAAALAAPALQGRVTQVIDGQTLLLAAADGKPVQVSLSGVVTPLLCEPGGTEAREGLKDWALNQEVLAAPVGRPEGGRLVAKVTLNGDDLSRRMVEEGHAWSLREKWDRGPYVKQERMAGALSRGLHGMAGVHPPPQYKRSGRPCAT
jgi:endonuclease YncB( thermonuclease family)